MNVEWSRAQDIEKAWAISIRGCPDNNNKRTGGRMRIAPAYVTRMVQALLASRLLVINKNNTLFHNLR